MGDNRYETLMDAILRLASPTGQWPEAIHPVLGTGCMGDGQHVWAAAEWVMMVKNCFVREEIASQSLVLCSGIRKEWLGSSNTLRFGPTDTVYGTLEITITKERDSIDVKWDGTLNHDVHSLTIAFPFLDDQECNLHDKKVSIPLLSDEIKKSSVAADESHL